MHFRRGRKLRRTAILSDGAKLDVKSGLEEKIALQIDGAGVPVLYEQLRLKYEVPGRTATYTPDFQLPNGIIVEGKGIFDADDRTKHLLVRQCLPDLDIRFVFTRPSAPLYKGSKTTYAMWCDKNGFRYAEKLIPPAWFKEKKK